MTLGFGTCQDVGWDPHPTERLVIICGSGAPYCRPPELDVPNLPMTYPFLLNDALSWLTDPVPPGQVSTKAQLWAAGYYQFLDVAPGTLSVLKSFDKNPAAQRNGFRTSNRSMEQCYLHPPTLKPDQGARTFAGALAAGAAHSGYSPRILTSTNAPQLSLYQCTGVLPLPPARH